MNLDDLAYIHALDPHNVLAAIDAFPDQVAQAWQFGQAQTLPPEYKTIRHLVLVGMGGSAIGAELAYALAAPECSIPMTLLRNYALPAFVGRETLVIGLSHSGETEEVVAACQTAVERGAKLLVITQGGPLAALAEKHGAALWRLDTAAPRLALGYMFIYALAALVKLGLLADKSPEMAEAVEALRTQQVTLRAESPVRSNPAKRMAGQIMERIGVFFAADHLIPVARHWKMLLNELGKAWAVADEVPEMNHNAIAGTLFPEALVSKFMVLCLRGSLTHPRNRLRVEATRAIYMTAGFNTDAIEAAGNTRLVQMLTAMHYGDYVAYYVAMCYGVDPSVVPQIAELKKELA